MSPSFTIFATYIWIISKEKTEERRGKVLLIDASQCFEKRRKSLGSKRGEITDRCHEMIVKAYKDFANWEYEDNDIRVESRVKDVEDFKYRKVFTYRPLRLTYSDIEYSEEKCDAMGIKEADRSLLKQLADYWHTISPNGNPAFPDFSFFFEFEKARIKIPQGKVALMSKILGK